MNKQMSEAARQAKNEYARQWRKNNPDRVRQNNINYWERRVKNLNNDED